MPLGKYEVEGLYDPRRRFAFTNITDEEFRSAWDGQPIVISAHKTVELPHHLAVKLKNELIDKLILGEALADEKKNTGTPYYRSPVRMSQFVPSKRAQYEDQILRELTVDEESPEMQVMRTQIRDELKRDMERQPGVATEPLPANVEEFAQIKKEKSPEVKVEKKPLKVKTL